MKRILAVLLFALSLALPAVAQITDARRVLQHKAAHTIVMRSALGKAAGCSATAINEHVLLTAQHCDVKDGFIYLDQEIAGQRPVKVSEKYYDKNDHMLLVVPGVTFKYFVKYSASATRIAVQGEHLYLFGNPDLMKDQYREGYVTGAMNFPASLLAAAELNAGGDFTMMAIPIIGGDSGSSVYSANDGQLVGITTWGINDGMFLGSYPLHFTQEQIDQASGEGTFVYAPESEPVVVNNVVPVPRTGNVSPFEMFVVVLTALLLLYSLPSFWNALRISGRFTMRVLVWLLRLNYRIIKSLSALTEKLGQF